MRIAGLSLLVSSLLLSGLFSGFMSDKSVSNIKKTEANAIVNTSFESHINNIYKTAGLYAAGLSRTAFEKAVIGYYNIKEASADKLNVPILSVIDFTKSSTEKRLWIIDMSHATLLFNTLVAHGRNSGEQYATHFSNTGSSYMSSLGFFVTAETYIGKHGLSLAIDGLENGINNNARSRSLVMHAADYVSEDFIKTVGRLGRSQGCPAVPADLAAQIIRTIANGSCLFIYYPDHKYEQTSGMLNLQNAIACFNKIQKQKFAQNPISKAGL